MTRLAKPLVLLALALAGTLAVACADSMLASRFGATPVQVFEPVSAEVQRTAPTVIESADGQVRVELPPLSVHATVTLTLSRVTGADPATGEPWTAYQLEPLELELERPARLSLGLAAQPADVAREDLRVARLLDDEGGAFWQVLEQPQATSTQVLGRTTRLGRFGVVDASRDNVVGSLPFTSTSEADVLLSRGQVEAARAAYAAVLARNADDTRARLGHALSALMLILDHDAVRNLLARCDLPPLAQDAWFGEGGYLARAAADRAGEAELGLELASSTTPLEVESVVSRASERWLQLRVDDTDHIDGPWLLRLTLDLAAAGTRFAFGQDIPVNDFPGRIELRSPNRRLQAQRGSMGTVHVEAAGRGAGQELALRFEGVTLIDAQGQLVRLNGRVHDLLQRTPLPPHPLFETAADPGPPHRERLAVLLDGCSQAFTAPFVFAQAQALRAELDAIAADLAQVLADTTSPGLQPGLPSFVLRSDQDLLLDRRDVELLRLLLQGAGLALDLAAPYRWFGHDADGQPSWLGAFLDTLALSFEDASGSLVEREERALSPEAIAEDLNRNLLAHDGSEEQRVQALAPLREPVQQWLGALEQALGQGSSAPGLVDLAAVDAQELVQGTRQLLAVLQRTLADGASAEPAPASPGYQVLARRWFEQPPEHAALAAACADGLLFEVRPGDPAAETAEGRNPALAMSSDFELALLQTALDLPPPPAVSDCSADEDCGAQSLRCELQAGTCAVSGAPCDGEEPCADASACVGQCARRPFALVSAAALQTALGDEQPAFATPRLWQLVRPLVETWWLP